ncbi:cyanate permease [Providencia alcalifaciens]|nr:cyanate permease [Providencia alcalifaciens]
MNLTSTLASLSPFFVGAIKDNSGRFTPAFLITAIPVCIIFVVTLIMKPYYQKIRLIDSANSLY